MALQRLVATASKHCHMNYFLRLLKWSEVLNSVVPNRGLRPLHVSAVSPGNLKAIRKDRRRRATVAEFEKERLHLRAILRNNILPEVVQRRASAELARHPRDASITRVRNRCVQTGRGRGVVGEFGLSRMKFRKLADFGMLAGVTRSTW